MGKQIEGYDIDLDAEEARAVLAASRIWQERIWSSRWNYWLWETRIEYDGRTLGLARTDLKDDIRTSPMMEHQDPKQAWTQKVQYGARVTDKDFYVIDAFSDG